MFSKKNAFTLIEILLVFLIIGIIITFETIVLQGQLNQYAAPYYNAYNTLFKAAYNVQADIYCPDDTLPPGKQICPDGPRPFPKTTKELCERLKEFINTVPGKGSCKNTDIDDNSSNGNQFDEKHLRFVATNSFRYYIAEKKFTDSNFKCPPEATGSLPQPCAGSNNKKNGLNYFVVYVDITGEKAPNRVGMSKSDEIYPDIVPFAITINGEVVPMGYPIYSKIYMTAKIKYPQIEIINNETGEVKGSHERQYSGSMDYFSAITGAWGGVANMEIPDSILFTEKMNDKFPGKSFYPNKKVKKYNYSQSNPTTANLTIEEDNTNYKVHYDDDATPTIKTKRCVPGTFDCEVIVDSMTEKRY